MMKREFIYSVIMHLAIIALVLFSAPFSIKPKDYNYDQVIKVRAVSMPQASAPSQADLVEQPAIPDAAMDDEFEDIPVDDPTSRDKPEPVKPKEKPKPKPKPTKKPAKTKQQPAETDNTESPGTPAGSKEVEPSPGKGSPFGTATVDNAQFDYPYWFDQSFNKISYNWRNPVAADIAIICVVKFDVIKSGKVFNIEVESSSGIPAFDDACVAAIQKSSPLPPFPKDFQYEIIGITLPFKYQPR